MASPLFLSPQPFRPATSSAAGLMGLVPSPAAGQQNYVLRGDSTWVDAQSPSLPAQAGNAGKYLSTNGTAALWATVSASPAAENLTGTTIASNVVNSSLTSVGSLSSLTVLSTIVGTATALTRNDGQYHLSLSRTSSIARSYGLAINSGTGEFILDDITAGATRLRISTLGAATIAGGLENTPIGASVPAAATFTNLSATGATFTRNDGLYHTTLTRTSAFARSYGLGINSGTGEFILDDITAGATRLRIAPTGALTVAGGVVAGDVSAAGNVSDSKGEIRLIPQNSQSVAYTLVQSDSGKHIFHPSADTTARTFTIPANSSVAYSLGTAITFVNQNAAGVVTIAITTDTMRLAAAGTTGSRTLAANGVATAIKITSTEWIISGNGLS
jgi:hypothetical protein